MTLGRNQPCPCGSGRKYKHCCAVQVPAAAAEHYRRGLEYAAAGRFDDAAACYRMALTIAPAFVTAEINLGNLLAAHGRLEEALRSFERAREFAPANLLAHYNAGNALLGLGRFTDAVARFRAALAIAPEDAFSHVNLGVALQRAGRLDEAEASLVRAAALAPGLAEARANLGKLRHAIGLAREAVDCLREAVALRPDAATYSALLMAGLYLEESDPARAFALHRGYADAVETPLRACWRPHANVRDPGRRLRLGYVSADFRKHSVAAFIEPVLAHHDHGAFEVYCYYNHATEDEVTRRLRACADAWLPCAALGDDALAQRIRADGIDILVDLSGHTRDNRLPVFARRPAPVQASWLGYPATTGLEAIDYRLCSEDSDPPGQEQWHSEALWRLPRSAWCHRPGEDIAAVSAQPPCMQLGYVTFAVINKLAKLSPAAIAVWSDIMGRVPASRLEITGVPAGSARQRLLARFAEHGIAADRITAHERLPASEFQALRARADFALDTFPYNGTTTTCETLWAGIPVIALRGEVSVARAGHALLRLLGLEELVAPDAATYVEIAVGLAREPGRLLTLRAGLRARFEASALRDEEGFTRELEAAYRGMWRRWCASRPVRSIHQ